MKFVAAPRKKVGKVVVKQETTLPSPSLKERAEIHPWFCSHKSELLQKGKKLPLLGGRHSTVDSVLASHPAGPGSILGQGVSKKNFPS